jgi:transcription initiation factor TFIID TATA-box-binding protein
MLSLENKPRSEIKIVNTVCTADLEQNVSLTDFNKYDNLSANLELYACGYVKNKTMIGRVTIFRTGKIISVGTKSIESAFKELEIAAKILKKHKLIKSYKLKPKTQNIVTSINIQRTINIEKFARSLPKVMYEPEQFPGLIMRFPGSTVALVFASGKIVLTGAKSYRELNSAYFELNRIF